MWVFAYGSLMWDDWEKEFSGRRQDGVVLNHFKRAFTKKSLLNWGTRERPCPTLGLADMERPLVKWGWFPRVGR